MEDQINAGMTTTCSISTH